MMKKIWKICGLAVVIAAVIVASVIITGGFSRPVVEPKPKTIGIVLPGNLAGSRESREAEILFAVAKSRGYYVKIHAANGSQELQNQQIQLLIEQSVDLLIVQSVNDRVRPMLRKIDEHNIPAICYNRAVANADYDCAVIFDAYQTGVLQAKTLLAGLQVDEPTPSRPRYLALFAGDIHDPESESLYEGAMSVLSPQIKSGELRVIGGAPTTAVGAEFSALSIPDDAPDKARTRLREILRQLPSQQNLDAILSPNDAVAGALIDELRDDLRYQIKLPLITGLNAEFSALKAIKNGEQFMTVMRDTRKLAETTILIADCILRKQTVAIPGVTLSMSDRLLSDAHGNSSQVYLLTPLAITRENFASAVDAGYFPAE